MRLLFEKLARKHVLSIPLFMLFILISGFIVDFSFCGEGGESEEIDGFQVVGAIYWEWADETNIALTYDGSEPVNVTVYKKEWLDRWIYRFEHIGMMHKGDVVDIGFWGYATWIEVLYDEERIRLTWTLETVGDTGEADLVTIVTEVIDGDTFDVTSGDRVRLADIDAPDYGESGYNEAKDFLTSLVQDKTVYLDIDDMYGTDKYGRLVCVAYVCVIPESTNEMLSKNINKALIDEGFAVISDYENEFNPYTWDLLCKPIPEFPSFLILPLFMIATLLAVIVYRRKLKQ